MNISNVVPRGTENAKVMQVIETKSLIGAGTEKDPVRFIYQYWDFEGNLLASKDTVEDKVFKFNRDELGRFGTVKSPETLIKEGLNELKKD